MAFEIKQGDRRPYFVVILKDDYGESTESVVDLSTAYAAGGTTAVFNMRPVGSAVAKVSRGSAAITAPGTAGEVTYQWGASDTDTAGTYEAEVEIIWADGKPETFPSGEGGGTYWTVVVADDIA